jgi:predicted N-acyltransferase
MNSTLTKKIEFLNSRFSCLDNQLKDRFLSDFERREIISNRNQVEKDIDSLEQAEKESICELHYDQRYQFALKHDHEKEAEAILQERIDLNYELIKNRSMSK